MPRVDAHIRSPTGGAWLATLGGTIAAGEVLYEQQRSTIATFFGRPFADDELTMPIVGLACIAALAILWLASLYARPGRLAVDPDSGRIRRERRPYLRRSVIDAPAADWRVRLVFFSEEERTRGAFKRLELHAPGLDEVLLYTDVESPDVLVAALGEIGPRLGAFESLVQRRAAAQP